MSSLERLNNFTSKYDHILTGESMTEDLQQFYSGVHLEKIGENAYTMYLVSAAIPVAVIMVLHDNVESWSAIDLSIIDEHGDYIASVHIDDSYDQPLDNVIYTLFDYYNLCDHMEQLNICCVKGRVPLPCSMLDTSVSEPNWEPLSTKSGKVFLRDNRLNFVKTSVTTPWNRLHLNLHNARLKSTAKGYITTTDSGQITINTLLDYDVVVLMSPPPSLSTVLTMYQRSIDIIKERHYADSSSKIEELFDDLISYFSEICDSAAHVETIVQENKDELQKFIRALIN